MRIDGDLFERLVKNYECLETMLTNYSKHVAETNEVKGENTQLRDKIRELETRLAAPEYRAKAERAAELDAQEQRIKDIKKLESDKGYATAYTEITQKMRQGL